MPSRPHCASLCHRNGDGHNAWVTKARCFQRQRGPGKRPPSAASGSAWPARAQHEPARAAHPARRSKRRLPQDDAILLGGQHVARRVEPAQGRRGAADDQSIGHAQAVVEVHVAQVPGDHGFRQMRGVRVPVQQVVSLRRLPLEIVVDNAEPDRIVGAKHLEHEAGFRPGTKTSSPDRHLALSERGLVQEGAEIARFLDLERRRQQRQAGVETVPLSMIGTPAGRGRRRPSPAGRGRVRSRPCCGSRSACGPSPSVLRC